MKKIDIFSKRNVATETFNEVSKIIETSDFKNQIRDFVKSMKIREVFLMKSEVIGVDSSELANKEKVFSEKSWLNLIDFLKTQLNLYENSGNKISVRDYITKTIDEHCYSMFNNGKNISSKSKNVDDLNYFLTDLNGVTFSYDIYKKTILMFVSDTGEYTTTDNKYFYQFGYYVNNKIQINTNLLKIFSFDYFGNFRNLYQNLENEFNLKFLKYAVGLEDESWLSSFIVSEIRSNFQNIISSWIEESLKFNSKVFHLEFFPYNFYKDGTVVLEPNFESEYEITDYISRKSYNDNFVTIDELINYYKTLLTAIINKEYDSILPSDENDDDCYWTNMEYPVSQWSEIVKTSKLTDSDVDRLKTELSPLINKVFEKLILTDIVAVSNYYVRRSTRDGLYYKFSLNILSDLLHHIGYSPSKLSIGKIIFRERKLLNTIEELSSVKYLKELEGFDLNISIILTEYVTEYYADKIPELEKLVKDKLGDNAELLTCNSPEYNGKRKAIDVTDLYPEYRIQRI